jgi:SagB-type dehydrogenase family enzyme
MILLTSVLIAPWALAEGQITLPPPQLKGSGSLEEALQARRSVRSYSKESLELSEVAQLAWAAQGITKKRRFRTAPSAGALYPLELYLLAGKVKGLDPGLYHYLPKQHAMEKIASTDMRTELAGAAYNQRALSRAPAVFVIAGVKKRTARKYRGRAERYVYIEAGHAGQNLLLQATSLGLGSVIIGAFFDDTVRDLLSLPDTHQPISLLPVGRQ